MANEDPKPFQTLKDVFDQWEKVPYHTQSEILHTVRALLHESAAQESRFQRQKYYWEQMTPNAELTRERIDAGRTRAFDNFAAQGALTMGYIYLSQFLERLGMGPEEK